MGTNAFQHNAFQQTVGFVAFQELIVIPAAIAGGRYITEQEVQESSVQKWKYQAGLDSLYKHIAATRLGYKGGMAYASTLGKKS